MATSLNHRGPDGHGVVRDQTAVVGATRLRIIDPRESGDQPFVGEDGTTVVCNGEIYNGREIRARFPVYRYRSNTDIEPIVPLMQREGPPGLSSLQGMFGLATWIPNTRTLVLARDRAGEKPLFYARIDNEVWFASELQALFMRPGRTPRWDEAAVADYLTFGYVTEPRTLDAEIRKVPAGAFVRFTAAATATMSLDPPVTGNRQSHFRPEQLRSLLNAAVRKQLHADVPVGIFLSGGLDSSLVTALARRARPNLRTFTVRFNTSTYDEGLFAREVAAHFETQHTEVWATPERLLDALDTVTARVAEPVSDPAVLPTSLLSEKAKQTVGVVLSGEGCDELFGGYPTYLGHQLARFVGSTPQPIRWAFQKLLARSAASADRVPTPMLLHRFLSHAHEPTAHRHACWFGTGLLPLLPHEWQERVADTETVGTDPVLWAMGSDFSGYLREGLLTKLDRASMLWSLETRAPFLDPDVVSFAQSLGRRHLVSGGRLKVALKEAAQGIVPTWVIKRRKRGLSVPIGRLINGPLRPTVDMLLDPRRIAKQGIMPDLPIARLLSEHRDGRANHGRPLWALVTMQLWLDKWEEIFTT